MVDELIQSLKRYQLACAYLRHAGMKDYAVARPLPAWWDK